MDPTPLHAPSKQAAPVPHAALHSRGTGASVQLLQPAVAAPVGIVGQGAPAAVAGCFPAGLQWELRAGSIQHGARHRPLVLPAQREQKEESHRQGSSPAGRGLTAAEPAALLLPSLLSGLEDEQGAVTHQ